jgi:hypothetical protein
MYKKGIYEKTMSPEKAKQRALEDFEMITQQTQQSTRISNISMLRGSSSIGRTVAMFTSAAGQVHRLTTSSWRNVMQGKDVGENLKNIMISHVVLGAMYGLAANSFKWDDKDMTWNVILGNVKGIPYIGQFISWYKDYVQKKPWAKSIRVSPVIENLKNISTLSNDLRTELAKEFPNKDKAILYGYKLSLEIAANRGLPAKGGIKLYKGVSKVVTEETDNPIRSVIGLDSEHSKGVELWEVFKPRPTDHVRGNETLKQYVKRREEQDKETYDEDKKTKVEDEYLIYKTKNDRVIYFYENLKNKKNVEKADYLMDVYDNTKNDKLFEELDKLGLISDSLYHLYKDRKKVKKKK